MSSITKSLNFIRFSSIRSSRSLSGVAVGAGHSFVEYKDKVAKITLEDIKRLNALTADMDLNKMIVEINKKVDEDDVRAVILTGSSAGKAFSAGGDLNFLWDRSRTDPEENKKIMMNFYESFLCIRHLKVPVISAINGHAVGAGAALAFAADIRLALSDAKISFPFTKLGIHPGMASTHTLPRISEQYAFHLCLNGTAISGREAQEAGLVLKSYDTEDELAKEANAMALNIASNSPIATQGTLKTLRDWKFEGLKESLTRESDEQAICYASEDFTKGLDAVKTRQTPIFHKR
jgi:enoyl-CoA hydratase